MKRETKLATLLMGLVAVLGLWGYSSAGGGSGISIQASVPLPLPAAYGGTGVANTVTFTAADAAPSAPVADDLWYETDTNIQWYWSGTYWLSTQVFTSPAADWVGVLEPTSSSTAAFSIHNISAFDVYLTSMSMNVYHDVAQDNSNYWTIGVYRRNSAGSNALIAAAGDTKLSTTINYAKYDITLNTFVQCNAVAPNDISRLFVEIDETGTAGNWLYNATLISYRLAHR